MTKYEQLMCESGVIAWVLQARLPALLGLRHLLAAVLRKGMGCRLLTTIQRAPIAQAWFSQEPDARHVRHEPGHSAVKFELTGASSLRGPQDSSPLVNATSTR